MRNKRVVFVEPRGAPSNVFAKFMTIPLMGPVYLGTIAKQDGYDVSILNENLLGREVSEEELSSIDILCMSCITATVDRGKAIARQYKEIRRSANLESRTIIGGIHASMAPDDVVEDFDQVVVGEAEDVILDVLSGKSDGKIVYGNRPEDLDALPLPDFSLLKGHEKMRIRPVMTSRGCPYDCSFCSVTEMFGRRYRSRSPENVMGEIKRYRSGRIFFIDDHFVANFRRTDKLLDLMIEDGFDRKWTAQTRTEVTKRSELIAKMRRAGCHTVYIGFESINPASLEEMQKRQTVEDIKRSIEVFHDNDIKVHGMFILGSDSDTKDTFDETSRFCRDTRLDYVQYSILTPFPGTRLYSQLEESNRLLHKDWQYYDGLHAVTRPVGMSAEDVQRGMIDCFSDFYSYAGAVNDALNALGAAFSALVMRTKSRLPSFSPPLMKVAGKKIVRDWLKKNRDYMGYLNVLSKMSSGLA